MAKHKEVAVNTTHFVRWLLLLETLLDKVCAPALGSVNAQADAVAVAMPTNSGARS